MLSIILKKEKKNRKKNDIMNKKQKIIILIVKIYIKSPQLLYHNKLNILVLMCFVFKFNNQTL
jgi:hypothetical protein